jgi:3-dehydroquinate synthase
MHYIQQSFHVDFQYRIHFTEHLFNKENHLLKKIFQDEKQLGIKRKLLFVIDAGVLKHFPSLEHAIINYFEDNEYVTCIKEIIEVPGGEVVKNDTQYFDKIIDAVDRHGIDRHSYIAAIGGGSTLDLTGYASTVAHRGIKQIRIPTTVLSQNDSGVGVKNSINYKGKKNFLGTFSPPFAVLNDTQFLTTLSDRDWAAGISEAIKVALIKDLDFFHWIDKNAESLALRDMVSMKYLIERCAELHIEHIGGGDPFEFGSSRPLDFGHWSAHKLEQLSDFQILHGEAVSLGIALDCVYSYLDHRISKEALNSIISLLKRCKLPITHELIQINSLDHPIFKGLEEFREHLGGQLTIMLLHKIGKGTEVHELDYSKVMQASQLLKNEF